MLKLGVLDDISTEYIYEKNHNHFYIKEIHNFISRVRDVHIMTNIIVLFVESAYNVSKDRMDRAFAGLSMGGMMITNIINNNPLRFGYYGMFSGLFARVSLNYTESQIMLFPHWHGAMGHNGKAASESAVFKITKKY